MGLFINNPYIKEYQRGLMEEINRKVDENLPYQLKLPEGWERIPTTEEAERRIAAAEKQKAADLQAQAVRQVDFEEACEQERARRRGMLPQDLMNELQRARDHETWLNAHKEATDQYLADIGKDEEAKEIVAQKRRAWLKGADKEHLEDAYKAEDVNIYTLYKQYTTAALAETAASPVSESGRQGR